MAKNKTTETRESVQDFISKVNDPLQREDSIKIVLLMTGETGFEARMWGPSIIGFGTYHYKYDSGHEGDAPLVAFSPRANAISLYMSSDFRERAELLGQLGKHKSGKGCIYIKKLEDVRIDIFKKLINYSVAALKKQYPDATS